MIMEYTCEEEGISIPQKRARMNCIIHCSDEEPGSKLVSPKNCCTVSSAPLFRLLRYGGFLEDIGAEVEVNPDDQYQFLSVYTRHNAPFSVA